MAKTRGGLISSFRTVDSQQASGIFKPNFKTALNGDDGFPQLHSFKINSNGTVTTFYPGDKVIELKSLKEYFFAFRSQIYSYERIINVIYDDMMKAYEPARLRLVMTCNPRGGISSKLTVDSDWSARGGEENFQDWIGQADEW